MGHTFTSNLQHIIFSTAARKPYRLLKDGRVCAYMGGIAKQNGMKALAVGGMEDHCHLLLSLPATMPVAKAVQLIKPGSSKWIHESFPGSDRFQWQEGYASFSVSISQRERTIAYIADQERHHQRRDFAAELKALLRAHGLEFDAEFLD